MDLDELRSVRRTERQKDSLQHLRDSFYEDVAAYIAERKAERQRTADRVDDPYGHPDVRRLTDEIGTAEDVVEAIYERRVGKVVKLASFAAADMSADKTGLTAEERALFDDLVERIKLNRRTVLDTLAAEDDGADDAAPPADGPPTSAGVDAAADPAPPGPEASPEPDSGVADPSTGGADDPSTPGADAPDTPPAPDDVLAAAMGGDDGDGSDPSPDPDPDPESRADAAADPAPPAADDPATPSPQQDIPPVDDAETDGGDAAVVAGEGADASPTSGGSASHDGREGSTAGGAGATAGDDDDRVTLRLTADVGRIYGVDEREYDLESGDVVRLPATNAGPLVDRDAAERLE